MNIPENTQTTQIAQAGPVNDPPILKAGGSVSVKGGIIGKQKGTLDIGDDLRCRFISGGAITVAGDVNIQSEIIHSRITCMGSLTVANGLIYGGEVTANGGISCPILGHASGTPTVVELGVGFAGRSQNRAVVAQIEANRKRVREVRSKIEPLLKHVKNLTAQQKEKATELLYEAGELEAATEQMVADLEKQSRLASDKARSQTSVESVAHLV